MQAFRWKGAWGRNRAGKRQDLRGQKGTSPCRQSLLKFAYAHAFYLLRWLPAPQVWTFSTPRGPYTPTPVIAHATPLPSALRRQGSLNPAVIRVHPTGDQVQYSIPFHSPVLVGGARRMPCNTYRPYDPYLQAAVSHAGAPAARITVPVRCGVHHGTLQQAKG